jgi:hypothetical protein
MMALLLEVKALRRPTTLYQNFQKRIIFTFKMPSSRMLRHVALVRTDISEELGASTISVTKIGELGTTLAVTSN